MSGNQRRRVQVVELTDAIGHRGGRRVGGHAVSDILQRLPRVDPHDGEPVRDGAAEFVESPLSACPTFATRPSHSVIAPAASARPTVVAQVTARLRCGATDIATPVP